MAICRCMTAGKNRKSHWVRSFPNTDIRTKSKDIVPLLKRSKRPASWVLQTCVYLGEFTLCLSSLLPTPSRRSC
ncbi:Bgt-20386-2 [Blumeria graminis f. sp. tritici]|uniref:Bgt-20386-2 n=2 Tax=Blumeria graminis f. sp. tritici TaxID=62690 RepID=A0A9X9MJM1_BLUGR|nr:Bgt-20386-2 [Blumeria graminis f. sp. tritici]